MVGGTYHRTARPFRVCMIEKIRQLQSGVVWLKLRFLFRPEDVSPSHLKKRRRSKYEPNEVPNSITIYVVQNNVFHNVF